LRASNAPQNASPSTLTLTTCLPLRNASGNARPRRSGCRYTRRRCRSRDAAPAPASLAHVRSALASASSSELAAHRSASTDPLEIEPRVRGREVGVPRMHAGCPVVARDTSRRTYPRRSARHGRILLRGSLLQRHKASFHSAQPRASRSSTQRPDNRPAANRWADVLARVFSALRLLRLVFVSPDLIWQSTPRAAALGFPAFSVSESAFCLACLSGFGWFFVASADLSLRL
jgi:hypothetical protein